MWTVKTLTGGPSGPYDPVNSVPCRNVGGGGDLFFRAVQISTSDAAS